LYRLESISDLMLQHQGEVPFKVMVEYKVVRSTIQSGIEANLVEKLSDERTERLQQRATVQGASQHRNRVVRLQEEDRSVSIVTVATGPNRGKRGHILGWRTGVVHMRMRK
jgi:hypothetical protein